MAQVDTPDSHEMIRKVVLTSVSIPLLFEPVRIPVTERAQVKEELHVEGGLTREIFVHPPAFVSDCMRNLFQLGNEMGAGEQNWMMEIQNYVDQS